MEAEYYAPKGLEPISICFQLLIGWNSYLCQSNAENTLELFWTKCCFLDTKGVIFIKIHFCTYRYVKSFLHTLHYTQYISLKKTVFYCRKYGYLSLSILSFYFALFQQSIYSLQKGKRSDYMTDVSIRQYWNDTRPILLFCIKYQIFPNHWLSPVIWLFILWPQIQLVTTTLTLSSSFESFQLHLAPFISGLSMLTYHNDNTVAIVTWG